MPATGSRLRHTTLILMLLLCVRGWGRVAVALSPPGTAARGDAPAAAKVGAAAGKATGANDPVLTAAQSLLDKGHFKEAAAAFAAANQAAGGHCGACLIGQSKAETRSGNRAKGAELARLALTILERDPLRGCAYSQLGEALLTKTTAAAAEEAFGKALGAGSSCRVEALAGISELRLLTQRYPEAASTARQAIEADATSHEAAGARSVICQARYEGYLTPSEAPMPLVQPHTSGDGAAPPQADSSSITRKPTDSMVPLRIQDQVVRPERLFGLPPAYCEEERKARTQGVVILEGIIERDGCVTNLSVLKRVTPCLDAAALKAVRGWVFAPASLDGLAVRVYYTLTVNFQVDLGPPPTAPSGPVT
jgi:TonB family protein